MLNKIMEMLSVPITLLNIAGGIVGGVWLAVLGEWKLIGLGILLVFTSRWILSILMMPRLPIAAISVYFYERKNSLGHLFGFISQFYTNLLIVVTCVFVFFICSQSYTGDIGIRFIQYLLLSWGMVGLIIVIVFLAVQ